MTDSRIVANKFLEIAHACGATLTPMQLLKLTYIAHGWMLGLHGTPLVDDEVQAWQYGPVIPKLYNSIKGYRGNPVSAQISRANGDELSDNEKSVVQQTFDIYGDLSGPALSRITHAEKTPWALTYQKHQFGLVIPQDLIQDHYTTLASRAA